MRKLFVFVLAASLLSACTKDPLEPGPSPLPVMRYNDLQNAEVRFSQAKSVDIDNDGKADFYFGVTLVGDPLLKRDRWQYIAHSKVGTHLLNDEHDQSPMLHKGDWVYASQPGYQWFEISAIVLAEKIVTMTETYWEGLWKNAAHKYLPVQLQKDQKTYNGWIELSFDAGSEKLILHRSAISTEANKAVKAGF